MGVVRRNVQIARQATNADAERLRQLLVRDLAGMNGIAAYALHDELPYLSDSGWGRYGPTVTSTPDCVVSPA
jgi:hypothetical protein